MVSSSISTPGRRATSEPVAMTIAFASRVLLGAVLALDDDLAGRGDPALAGDAVDLVLLEQERNAVDVGGDGVVLVLHHHRQIELRRADDDAERRHAVPRLLEHLGSVQQRLRGDAADVEASAAERLALFDHDHLHAELGCADGADITAGAGADDDEVVHEVVSLFFTPTFQAWAAATGGAS